MQRPTPENKQKLANISKRVAAAMTEIIQAAEAIKG
jgi:talin